MALGACLGTVDSSTDLRSGPVQAGGALHGTLIVRSVAT